MTNISSNLKYMKSDEWFDAASGKIGISDYAQNSLSDIVFVEILVEPGDDIESGKAIASVESVKASAEVYSPVNGRVIAINEELANAPETINSDPYGAAWLIQVEGGDASAMMSATEYEKYCAGRDQ
jgi:glycine cleavage system H protein